MALNVILVDDAETIRAVIAKTLEMVGLPIAEIFQVSNGEEALDLLHTNWVDLVFTDINMPVMGGEEMIDRMGDHLLLKAIPVIVVSTEGSATRIEELKSRGVRAFVRKPFTPETLKEAIDEVVGVQNER